MTLIAIATYGKTAEFITDSLNYSYNGARMGQSTKSRVLHHLDAAVLTQGDSDFGNMVTTALDIASRDTPDFDALLAIAPEVARACWTEVDTDYMATTLFLVGHSPATGQFRAHHLAADSDFAPEEITGLHVMPSPFNMRASDLELDRIQSDDPDAGGYMSPEVLAEARELWLAKPAPAVPKNKTEWVNLAKLVREHRALNGDVLTVFVGGRVHHTRLAVGKSSTHVIHTYDDSGAEFQQMVAYTAHPQGQVTPCWCESGERHIDCHGAHRLDKPCQCRSGAVMRECCAVDVRGGALVEAKAGTLSRAQA